MIIRIFLLLLFVISLNGNDIERYLRKYKNEPRTALIIGNGNYSFFAKLKNPINDAKDMRFILAKKGFNTIYLENASRKKIKEAIRLFYKKIRKGGVGLFYYAGQGIEYNLKNYLIPVGADIKEIEDVESDAVPLSQITSRMVKAKNRLNIVILDASRSNPFTRGGGDGLTNIQNTKGIFIAYATEPGKVAREKKKGRNGLFTKYIKKYIQIEGLNIDEVFNKVRVGVNRESNYRQLPYASTGIIGTFYFTLPQPIKIALDSDIIDSINSGINSRKSVRGVTKPVDEKISLNMYSLKINTFPPDASIDIINKSVEYFDNIKLQEGIYKIKISKLGYISKKGTVNLNKNRVLSITLDKSQKQIIKKTMTVVKSKKVKSPTKIKKSPNSWIDPITNLMWERKTKKNKNRDIDWYGAKKYCEKLILDDFKDWRLPTRKELQSLMTNKKTAGNYIKKELSKQIGLWGWYWSMTDENDEESWIIYYNDRIESFYHKSGKFYVRCVRRL